MTALSRYILCLLVGCSCALNAETLDLQTAIARMLSSSTALKIARLEIDAKDAEAWQNSLYPNPYISLEIDSFGGRHENRGFDSAEFSYSVTQLILLGGKRSARMNLDGANGTVARWEYEIALQDAIQELTHAFLDAYVAQEKLKLEQKQSQVALESHFCTAEKVKNGKATQLQEKKGALTVRTCEIGVEKARRAFESAKQALASFWEMGPDFDTLFYPFNEIEPVPPLSTYEEMIPLSPEFFKAEATLQAAMAEKRVEEIQWIPDVEVSAGVGTPRDFSDQDFFVSFSFPLPIFDRNQGNVCRAAVQSAQALYAKESFEVMQRKCLAAAHRAWMDAYQNARAYLDLGEAYAQESEDSTEESFNQGKSERQDWLDAQKTLLDTQEEMVDALAEYHNKKVETLRAAGALLPNCAAAQP